MNSKTVSSLLPDDIEGLLSEAKNKVFLLGEQIKACEMTLVQKKAELATVDGRLIEVNAKISDISENIDNKNAQYAEKDNKIAQRESALDVYSNALQEKEKKIKKYLIIFENMKDVIS